MLEPEVIKGLFAAGGTAIGAVGGAIVKSYFENKNFFSLSKGRQQSLTGVWKGEVCQVSKEGVGLSYTVELNLSASKKSISGTGKIFVQQDVYKVNLKGAFRNDKFLRMEYENTNPDIVQFGAFVFELSADLQRLNGQVIGYGHKSETVVHGLVYLKIE